MFKKNTYEHWTRVTRSNPSWVSDTSKQVWSSVVPRVFSLCSMAAAGEKTLAHGRNHVTDSSTDSGNFFKIAAKIKSERIWVQGLETGEKQTKWRQRQTRKKLKICKNALKGHRNTAEWYILFSVPWPSLVLSLNVLAYSALYNCLQLNFSTPASFHCFLFFCLLWVSKVQFSSFVKGGAFSNRERNLFHARNFKNGPLKPGNFSVMTLKTLPSEFHLRIYWFADRSFYKLSSVMLQTFIKVSDYCFSICKHFDWTL